MQQFSFNPAFLIDLIFTKEYLQIYTKEYHLLSDKFPLILICQRVNDIPF